MWKALHFTNPFTTVWIASHSQLPDGLLCLITWMLTLPRSGDHFVTNCGFSPFVFFLEVAWLGSRASWAVSQWEYLLSSFPARDMPHPPLTESWGDIKGIQNTSRSAPMQDSSIAHNLKGWGMQLKGKRYARCYTWRRGTGIVRTLSTNRISEKASQPRAPRGNAVGKTEWLSSTRFRHLRFRGLRPRGLLVPGIRAPRALQDGAAAFFSQALSSSCSSGPFMCLVMKTQDCRKVRRKRTGTAILCVWAVDLWESLDPKILSRYCIIQTIFLI